MATYYARSVYVVGYRNGSRHEMVFAGWRWSRTTLATRWCLFSMRPRAPSTFSTSLCSVG